MSFEINGVFGNQEDGVKARSPEEAPGLETFLIMDITKIQ